MSSRLPFSSVEKDTKSLRCPFLSSMWLSSRRYGGGDGRGDCHVARCWGKSTHPAKNTSIRVRGPARRLSGGDHRDAGLSEERILLRVHMDKNVSCRVPLPDARKMTPI